MNKIRENSFEEFAVFDYSEKWEKCVARLCPLINKPNEIRSPFDRDATRILHSSAYRRLKHKTQVFFCNK